MVNTTNMNDILVNSHSLEDVAASEISDNRAQSIQSLNTEADQETPTPTPTPTATPTPEQIPVRRPVTMTPDTELSLDVLKERLEQSERNISEIKEKRDQLLSIAQAFRKHLETMELENSKNEKHLKDNYEDVDELNADVNKLKSRIHQVSKFNDEQAELEATLDAALKPLSLTSPLSFQLGQTSQGETLNKLTNGLQTKPPPVQKPTPVEEKRDNENKYNRQVPIVCEKKEPKLPTAPSTPTPIHYPPVRTTPTNRKESIDSTRCMSPAIARDQALHRRDVSETCTLSNAAIDHSQVLSVEEKEPLLLDIIQNQMKVISHTYKDINSPALKSCVENTLCHVKSELEECLMNLCRGISNPTLMDRAQSEHVSSYESRSLRTGPVSPHHHHQHNYHQVQNQRVAQRVCQSETRWNGNFQCNCQQCAAYENI